MKLTIQEPSAIDLTETYSHAPRVVWKKRQVTRRILIHDSHTSPFIENAEDFLRNLGRKMGLLDLGYHAIVERSGLVRETRDHGLIGSHAPGLNLDSIGICLIGGMGATGPEDNFEHQQRAGLFLYMKRMETLYGELEIMGHSEKQRHLDASYRCPALDMDMLRSDYKYFKDFGIIP